LALCLAGTACVHQELAPIRETTLTVARAGNDVTLSWIGTRGTYYSVMYTEARGARAKWNFLPDAVNILAAVSGEPILVKDSPPINKQRYYRLMQNTKPLVP
jgi:hypothetical protein